MTEILLLLLAAAGCLVESALIRGSPLGHFTPDTALVLVLFATLALPFCRGLVAGFCLGLVADLASGFPEGVNVLLYTAVFLLGKGIQAKMFFRGPVAAGLLLVLAFGLKPLLFASLLPSLRGPWLLKPAIWTAWGGEFVATVFWAPLLFLLLVKGQAGESCALSSRESAQE